MKPVLFITVILTIAACKKSSDKPAASDPWVSITDVTHIEGNGGTSDFAFTLTLDKAAPHTCSISFSTIEGTAVAGNDYTAVTNQVVTFNEGETSKEAIVKVIADDTREADETFTINLTNPSGLKIKKQQAVGTIENDDTKILFTNDGYDAPAGYAGYTLAWSDEFNAGSLDMTAWSFDLGDGCPGICGWGNNELEYYTSRPENIFFQDGKLIIEARKENFGGKSYTSAKIKTAGKKSFRFGRMDIRARLPKGQGIWPAIWMLPQDNTFGGWPASGEIDIMENLGHEPNKTYGTAHYGPGPGSIQYGNSYTTTGANLNEAFHVFSIEWKQDEIRWYVDNNLFSTFKKTDAGSATYPFNEDFYFILNLAVGGNWPGSPDASTQFPQWLIVDYVRVYQ